MNKPCETFIAKNKLTLGGHNFERVGELYKCRNCPLVIDQAILNAIHKKQVEQEGENHERSTN